MSSEKLRKSFLRNGRNAGTATGLRDWTVLVQRVETNAKVTKIKNLIEPFILRQLKFHPTMLFLLTPPYNFDRILAKNLKSNVFPSRARKGR